VLRERLVVRFFAAFGNAEDAALYNYLLALGWADFFRNVQNL